MNIKNKEELNEGIFEKENNEIKIKNETEIKSNENNAIKTDIKNDENNVDKIKEETDIEINENINEEINKNEINEIKTEEVKKLQRRLRDLRYYQGEIDGQYGPQTAEAVSVFQKANALEADGVVGDETRTVLYSTQAKPYSGE